MPFRLKPVRYRTGPLRRSSHASILPRRPPSVGMRYTTGWNESVTYAASSVKVMSLISERSGRGEKLGPPPGASKVRSRRFEAMS